MKPYDVIFNPSAPVLADGSFLLDAPAGKDGFITVRDGHLVRPDGRRFRIWGVNMSFSGSTPSKEVAPLLAAHLARFGVNCIRVHHFDWRAPQGVIDSKFPDSQHLDPDKLDRLDFFVAELKKRGIYTNLNLNVARKFMPADGVRDTDQIGYAKAMTIFNERMIELEQDYARQLLTHKNPYTGNEYRNEPAIALVEMINENSIIESWAANRLQGKGPDPTSLDQTWADIPASYAAELDEKYSAYLAKRNLPAVPRLTRPEFAAADAKRFQTEAEFYMSLENSFFQRMYAYLKNDLKVHAPLVGTSAHNGGLTPYPLLTSTSKMDVVDGHTYWQHPRYLKDPVTGKRTFEIGNTSMIKDPAHSTIANLSRVAVAGKPYIVSEVNNPYPNEFAAEAFPIAAAYAAFQDWDGIFWYSFSHQAAEDWHPSPPGHFDIHQDPVRMTGLLAGAILFLRADVQPAKVTHLRSYSPEQVAESIRMDRKQGPYFTPGLNPTAPLVHATRIASLNGQPSPGDSIPAVEPLQSDTGELTWGDAVTVDTPRAQELIGNAKATRNMAEEIANPFTVVTLEALDNSPIARASTLLLTASAKSANTGMTWNEKRTSTPELGSGGMWIEPVTGAITLKIDKAKRVEVQALDGGGSALGPPAQARKTSEGWRVELAAPSPWYLVRVTR